MEDDHSDMASTQTATDGNSVPDDSERKLHETLELILKRIDRIEATIISSCGGQVDKLGREKEEAKKLVTPPTTEAETQPSAPSTSPETVQDVQEKSHFSVQSKLLSTFPPPHSFAAHRLAVYDKVEIDSQYLDLSTGIFRAPLDGEYDFCVVWKQEGEGKLKGSLVCGRDAESNGVVGKSQEDGERCGKEVSVQCKAGDELWVEIQRSRGGARLKWCQFAGKLRRATQEEEEEEESSTDEEYA